MRLKNIEDFADWTSIAERIQDAESVGLSERERNAIAAFRVAVERRRRGLPDDEGRGGISKQGADDVDEEN